MTAVSNAQRTVSSLLGTRFTIALPFVGPILRIVWSPRRTSTHSLPTMRSLNCSWTSIRLVFTSETVDQWSYRIASSQLPIICVSWTFYSWTTPPFRKLDISGRRPGFGLLIPKSSKSLNICLLASISQFSSPCATMLTHNTGLRLKLYSEITASTTEKGCSRSPLCCLASNHFLQ